MSAPRSTPLLAGEGIEKINAFEQPENLVQIRTEGGPVTRISGPAIIFVSDREKAIYVLDGDHEELERTLLGRDRAIAAALIELVAARLHYDEMHQ